MRDLFVHESRLYDLIDDFDEALRLLETIDSKTAAPVEDTIRRAIVLLNDFLSLEETAS